MMNITHWNLIALNAFLKQLVWDVLRHMALQRYSASSSEYDSSSSGSASSSEDAVEPPAKKVRPLVESICNLSWNQLQSLELETESV